MKFSHFDVVPHDQTGQLTFKYHDGGQRYLGREETEMWEMIQSLEKQLADRPGRKKKEIDNETV